MICVTGIGGKISKSKINRKLADRLFVTTEGTKVCTTLHRKKSTITFQILNVRVPKLY